MPNVLLAQDRTRPTVTASSPPNGATGVDPLAVIRFTFSEPMKPQHQILWISSPVTVASNQVAYSWSADGLELTASMASGWPSKQKISWIFQASIPAVPPFSEGVKSFEDLAGNRLAGGAGSFSTSAGGPPPFVLTTNNCGLVASNLLRTTLDISLSARFTQTNASNLPLPLADIGNTPFTSVVNVIPGLGSATSVTLETPGSRSLALTHRSGQFSRTDAFGALENVALAFPAGTYRWLVTGASGDMPNQAEITLPPVVWPILRVTNHDFLQGVPGTNAIPILWEALGGPTSGSIQITVHPINNPSLTLWSSPDPGCPGAIPATATAAEIPFEALPSGTHFYVEIRNESLLTATSAGASARSGIFQSSTTRVRLVLCRAGVPSRERDRDPTGLPELCASNSNDTTTTNTLGFISLPRLQGDQIQFTVGPTVPGSTYQLFEWLIQTNRSTPRAGSGATGDTVSTPVGPAQLATTNQMEFTVPFNPTEPVRLFGVGPRGGRR